MKRFYTDSYYTVTHSAKGHQAYQLNTFYGVLYSENTFQSVFLLNFHVQIIQTMGKVRKGLSVRRKTQFKKGHASLLKGLKKEVKKYSDEKVVYVRPVRSEYEAATSEPIEFQALAEDDTLDTEPAADVKYRVLRPRKDPGFEEAVDEICPTLDRAINEGYRTFHITKLMNMMNEVFKEHQNYCSGPCSCPGSLQLDLTAEVKWGFAWTERVKCEKCKYTSRRYKLFEEVETSGRGRKAATINVGISVAITQTPVGPTSLRHIFHGGNIPAASRQGMHKTAKKVSQTIIEANKMDMKLRLNKTKRVLQMRNRPDSELQVQSDSVYNNSLYSAVGKNPFQAGTQAVYTVAENITENHDIIEVETINKLCSKHGFHDRESMTSCSLKNGQCSATHPMEDNIGDEKRWAKKTFERLKEQGAEIKHLTTDPDTAAFKAAEEMYQDGETKTKPIHQIDTRHLSKNHRKYIRNNENVLKMMPGGTAKLRGEQRNRFAFDLSQRCYAEFKQIHMQERGNFNKLQTRVQKCILAMLKCYAGNHSECKIHSAVCRGEKNSNWFCPSSIYLNPSFKIETELHRETFLDCVNYRLGPERLKLTKLNSNSQKVEATNRAIKRSLPTNVTFTRNFQCRAHSAIHRVNNGPGKSLTKLLARAGCPVSFKVGRALLSEQQFSENKKRHEKTLAYAQTRKQRKMKIYNLYQRRREVKNYQRGMLLRMKAARRSATKILNRRPRHAEDHNYSRNLPVHEVATLNIHDSSTGQEQSPARTQSCR